MSEHKVTRKKRSKKIGLPPGTLVHIGAVPTEKAKLSIFYYTESEYEERIINNLEELDAYRSRPGNIWLNIDAVNDLQLIEKIGAYFELHGLTLEDIANTEQRPKREDFTSYIYVVLKMLHHNDSKDKQFTPEQVSLILGPRYVITFQEQERKGDVFNFVRERIRNNKSRLRRSGVDYLMYALMDAIVDYYFYVLETLGEEIEVLESKIVADPGPDLLPELYSLKRQTLFFRRSVWPLREVVVALEREETELISDATHMYLRDIYDHVIQVIDNIETDRERLASMLDIYLSSTSNRLNSVMKVLTIITVIFMPLTFIAGIYGMNFEHMPELKLEMGYPLTLAAMGLIALSMIVYFRRKGWM